jgi:DNA-binding transcriptional ArsR family regulator
MTMPDDPQLDSALGAISDPTRRALFEIVMAEPGVTTSELAERTPAMTRWGVIKHLAVLRDAGLIQTMATGRLKRHYAEPAALGVVRAWLSRV